MPDMRSAQSVVEVSVMLLFVTTGFMVRGRASCLLRHAA